MKIKNLFNSKILLLSLVTSQLTVLSCADDGINGIDGTDGKDFTKETLKPLESSVVPNTVFELKGGFSASAKLDMMMTSKDILPSDSSFVYGAFMDGLALFPYEDGTYALINNLEADYSIARIRLNDQLQPLEGDYIVNATATAFTAMCSGSAVTVKEHGFGPLFLSGGEWGGNAKGVYKINPFRAAEARVEVGRLPALGEWSTENAVVIGKDAYPNQTVVFMGDDDSNNSYPEAHFAMYVGGRGDLNSGDLYVLRGKNAVESAPGEGGLLFEKGMKEGANRGTTFGRIYKLVLNPNNPTGDAKLEVVVDGDKEGGIGDGMHSPDNILVTENFAYIQEDPNGYADQNADISG